MVLDLQSWRWPLLALLASLSSLTQAETGPIGPAPMPYSAPTPYNPGSAMPKAFLGAPMEPRPRMDALPLQPNLVPAPQAGRSKASAPSAQPTPAAIPGGKASTGVNMHQAQDWARIAALGKRIDVAQAQLEVLLAKGKGDLKTLSPADREKGQALITSWRKDERSLQVLVDQGKASAWPSAGPTPTYVGRKP